MAACFGSASRLGLIYSKNLQSWKGLEEVPVVYDVISSFLCGLRHLLAFVLILLGWLFPMEQSSGDRPSSPASSATVM